MEKRNIEISLRKIIEENTVLSSDDWFNGLEDRKKEEVALHDKLRDMDFRKNASDEEVKKFFSNTKMLDGFNQSGDSLFTDNQIWFDSDYLLKNSISGLSDNYFNRLISVVFLDTNLKFFSKSLYCINFSYQLPFL